MEALLILDLQKGMIKNGDYRDTLDNIENLIEMFVKEEKLIISFKHIDENVDSSIYKESDGAELVDVAKDNSDYIITKQTPDIFFRY